MKSITEQASTVAQAIQKGWEKAGKPKEFSVKVFQESTTNFFGFTKEPAKVGIFFDSPDAHKDVVSSPANRRRQISHGQSAQRASASSSVKEGQREFGSDQQKRQARTISPSVPQDIARPRQEQRPVQSSAEEGSREIWSDALTLHAREWITDVLAHMQLAYVSFKVETSQYDLRIIFDKPIAADQARQQQAFRGMSMLLMQSLRHKLRRPLRGFRVIFSSL